MVSYKNYTYFSFEYFLLQAHKWFNKIKISILIKLILK